MSNKPLTPRERVESLARSVDSNDTRAWQSLSRQLAAEIEEANRRAEAAERQLARYREKYGELE